MSVQIIYFKKGVKNKFSSKIESLVLERYLCLKRQILNCILKNSSSCIGQSKYFQELNRPYVSRFFQIKKEQVVLFFERKTYNFLSLKH